MQTLRMTESTTYLAFWHEDWLRKAIDELDTWKTTPEKRTLFAIRETGLVRARCPLNLVQIAGPDR